MEESMENNNIFYTQKEVENIIKSKERLMFVDDGIEKFLIKYQDIPDFIVDYNNRYGSTDLKLYELEDLTLAITTFGFFLNYCKPNIREDIIERLINLQQGGKVKKYKIISGDDFDKVTNYLDKSNIKI